MSNYYNNITQNLLTIYDKVMLLKIFVDSDDNTLKNMYYDSVINHNEKILNNPSYIDAGFDLFAPGNQNDNELHFYGPGWLDAKPVNKLDFNVCCSAKMVNDTGKTYNTGYYMYPRSSLSKTQLRLANSTGIIDSGYRGHLIGMFDVVNIDNNSDDREYDYIGNKYDRYLQICAPGLVPIVVEMVDSKEKLGEKTERGDGGFGSTGR
jgi:dUTPase